MVHVVHVHVANVHVCTCTVDFTSNRMPVAVAAGNLWFVCSIGCNIIVANRTDHKFPAAKPPSELKSTVLDILTTLMPAMHAYC